jgi:putative acetyltransferase
LIIRPDMAAEIDRIADLLRESFPTPGEALLVERLRADGDAVMSLVAEAEGRIAAYAMFSRITAPFRALGLGPVATAAAARRQGLTSALIVGGLARARAAGWEACFVLGNPRFYGRFGFSVELARGFDCAYAGPHFMAMGLQGMGMPALTGRVAYARAFAEV